LGATGNPYSHGDLGKGETGAQGQGKSEFYEGLDTWRGWVTPVGLVALKGS